MLFRWCDPAAGFIHTVSEGGESLILGKLVCLETGGYERSHATLMKHFAFRISVNPQVITVLVPTEFAWFFNASAIKWHMPDFPITIITYWLI